MTSTQTYAQQKAYTKTIDTLPVKSFVLNNGHQIPSLGYGTYKTSPGEAKEAIKRALKQGYRHIDNADCYGNAKEISDGIKESNIPREKLFITSKLWVTYHDHVEEAIDKILKELDTNYLDLLLIHFPTPLRYIPEGTSTVKYPKTGDGKLDAVNIPLEQTWKDMEEYGIRSGKVRSIGVSNFSVKNLEKIVNSCQILPAVNQIECHPYLPCHTEYNYAKRYGILLEAYSPLGGSNAHLIEDEEVLSIANKHKVSPSQVIISWNTQRGVITLPKSLSEDHIKENSRLINLTNDEMEVLGTMPSRGKFNRYMKPDWSPHKLGFEDWD